MYYFAYPNLSRSLSHLETFPAGLLESYMRRGPGAEVNVSTPEAPPAAGLTLLRRKWQLSRVQRQL